MLQLRLQEIFSELHGEFEWDEDARVLANSWFNSGMPPVPEHGRLQHYNSRRDIHSMKLAMLSSVSAEHGLRVTKFDFERSQNWLLSAEKLMPDIFRAMVQKSDGQLLEDLHYHVYTEWAKVAREKRKPVVEKIIWQFLSERATSDRIPKLLENAIRSGRLERGLHPNEYIPRPLTNESGIQ